MARYICKVDSKTGYYSIINTLNEIGDADYNSEKFGVGEIMALVPLKYNADIIVNALNLVYEADNGRV